jgi:arsenite-transporting ATPase
MSSVRLVLYTGKGGVGKTTTAAATAVCAAERGRRTLVLSADAAHSLGDVLGERLSSEPRRVAERLSALEVDARVEMARHWGSIRDYLVSLFRYQGIEEVVAEELALLPGAEEVTTLMAVEEQVRSGDWDFVVVDCAPTDTTLRLVTLPEMAHASLRLLLKLQRALSMVVTPLARNLVPLPLPDSEVFRDAEALLYRKLRRLRRRIVAPQTGVRLVLTPERLVIDEGRRAFTDLCLFEVPCDAVVMNRMLPAAAASEEFFRDWSRLQEERLREVEELFSPLRLLAAPHQDDEVVGLARLSEHGRSLFAEVEPDALLSESQRVRFVRSPRGYLARLPLPGAAPEHLEVAKLDDELVVRSGGIRRALMLPRRIARLALIEARLEGAELVVSFASDAPEGA